MIKMLYKVRIVKMVNGVKKIVDSRTIDKFENSFIYKKKKYKLSIIEPIEEYDGKKFFYYDVTDNYQITNIFTIERLRTNMLLQDTNLLLWNGVVVSLVLFMIFLMVWQYTYGGI